MDTLFKAQYSFLIFTILTILSCKESVSQVTDTDGNTYKTVIIGEQEWMSENMNVEHYRNGDEIPKVHDPDEWGNLNSGAWCYYKYNSENGKIYGKLYNWYAVHDPRGLAPEGWHIPSDAEWAQLVDYLGGKEIAGGKLKSKSLWKKPNKGATNSSGFSGLPSGNFHFNKYFTDIGIYAGYWTDSEKDEYNAYFYVLYYSTIDVSHFDNGWNKSEGMSIRCVKD